ncbi:autophagy protein Apg5 [Colletotrichum musicola]|uniref:Autophagy protein 5 n=1 Tax=Colletotrichum musicola TaxID=2175873 RepID=A0A8H6JJU8_9PEZI|nr:autophagy protein Apg5 [Colletotrichum musicola]
MDSLPQTLWRAQIPLHITHPSRPNSPLVTSLPRFSYLALLAPRCAAFFRAPVSAFHHEDLLLRNLPLGLLVDLYQPSLPWRLTVSDGDSWDIGDTFLNCVKEADFVRYGNAKRIMSLSKSDTASLWNAVVDNDFPSFARVNALLLNAPTPLRNVPLRVYIPSSPPSSSPQPAASGDAAATGAFKVLQTLVPPTVPGTRNTPQTLGAALRACLPSLFPSSRDPVLANVVLHGSPVPFGAPLEGLMREAAYPDGWLCLAVVLL